MATKGSKRTGKARAPGAAGTAPAKARALRALQESEARFRSLTNLSSDWYWEQDSEYRFVRMEGRRVAGGDPKLTMRLIGIRRWESGLQIDGGWDAHRAALEARQPFRNVLMWRQVGDGSLRYVRVSGEPVFAADGSFTGYRGVGREVTAEKRAERLLRLEHQVARALSESEDAASGIRAVMQAVCESEGWPCGCHFALEEASGLLRFDTAWHAGADARVAAFVEASRQLTFAPGSGLVGKVLESGEPAWTSDAGNDPRMLAPALSALSGFNGSLAFAVVSGNRRIGVLAFSSATLPAPHDRLLQASRMIGNQVGQFLQRKRTEAALRESEERFRSLTQLSSDFYWETDPEHRFTQVAHGKNFADRFGDVILGKCAWELPYSSPDAAGWARLQEVLVQRAPIRDFEFGRPRRDGTVRHYLVSGEPRRDAHGRFLGYRGIGRDITEVVRAREHIAALAYSDSLTGLSNRTSLGPAFEQAVERARRRGGRLAALFIDLDGFKLVNDAHGHHAGDRFLVEIARRLRGAVRASDLVARLGGDEFFAVLEDLQEVDSVETVARKLLTELARPVELSAGAQARVTGSIGIAICPDDAGDAARLMRLADAAMYASKQAGKNAFRFYSEGALPAEREAAPGVS